MSMALTGGVAPIGKQVLTALQIWRRAASQVVRAEPMSTLDVELNDFGTQFAMLGGHAADRDG